MKRLAAAAALVALCCSAVAQAQSARKIAKGWTLHPRRGSSVRSAVSCGREVAAMRQWHGQVAVFDGSRWTELPPIPGHRKGRTYGDGLAITRSGDEIFVEASGRVARWDGRAWSIIELPGWSGPMGALQVLDSGELVVVGWGRIGLRVGTTISSHDAGTWRDLTAVAGASLNDLWTGGQGGTIMHRQASGWARSRTAVSGWIRGLLVQPSTVWAWGQAAPNERAPLVLRGAGGSFAWAGQGLSEPVQGMAGDGAKPWAVGDSFIARFDGSRWSRELSASDIGPDYQAFRGICATRHFVLVGNLGKDGGALTHPRAAGAP